MSAIPVEVAQPDGSQIHPADSPRFTRRLLRRPIAVGCIIYLVLLIGVAIVAPLAMPWVSHEHAGDLLAIRKGPSLQHLLGTDSLGRDVLARLLVGTRITLVAVAAAMIVGLAIGVPSGLIAGYFGGRIDRIVGWLSDLTFSMPALIIILVVLTVFPGNTLAGMISLGVLMSPYLMRVVRSATLPIREELYIAAARVSGLSRPYIITRHVLPRVAGPIIVQASLFAGVAVLVQAGLAYLGLLEAPPAPSWGGMINDGIQNIVLQPWLIWPPGVMIALTILAFGLLADAVRDTNTENWQAPVRRRRRRAMGRFRSRRASFAPNGFDATRPAANLSNDSVPRASRGNSAASVSVTSRTSSPPREPLLTIDGLSIAFPSSRGPVPVVEDVSFEIGHAECVGIVGESGCGKTVTAMAILRLLPGEGEITKGRIMLQGRDLTTLSEPDLHRVRGNEIALISQEPMVSLNPAFRVGWQLAHCLRVHHGISRKEARERAIELLARVQLPEPDVVAQRYPHELSGGMAQRVAIARALSGNPKLLIADEPTTALDVTIQAEILDLLRQLQRDEGMAILLVTHDWGVIADICQRAVVIYAGQVVERAAMGAIFHEPLHPYTKALLASNPYNLLDAEVLPTIPGNVPRPGGWPKGCHFHPRCDYATVACQENAIELEHPGEERETRCIHYEQLRTR